MSAGEEVIVKGSASRCALCRRRWKEEFPDTPVGCFFAGQAQEPFVYFDLETGWPKRCETGDPTPPDPTAYAVLDVLDHTRDQLTGEGAGISVEAMRTVAALRGVTVDDTFLDLWAAASGEWMTIRGEMIKESMNRPSE